MYQRRNSFDNSNFSPVTPIKRDFPPQTLQRPSKHDGTSTASSSRSPSPLPNDTIPVYVKENTYEPGGSPYFAERFYQWKTTGKGDDGQMLSNLPDNEYERGEKNQPDIHEQQQIQTHSHKQSSGNKRARHVKRWKWGAWIEEGFEEDVYVDPTMPVVDSHYSLAAYPLATNKDGDQMGAVLQFIIYVNGGKIEKQEDMRLKKCFDILA